jgi:hypothetical protein
MNTTKDVIMKVTDYADLIILDVNELGRIMRSRGCEWVCQTLSNICLDHEMEAVDGSPIEAGWIARRKAFAMLSRKMTKISGDITRAQIANEPL